MKKQLIEIAGWFAVSVIKHGPNNNELAAMCYNPLTERHEIDYDLMRDVFGIDDVLEGRTDMQVYGAIREIEQHLSPN